MKLRNCLIAACFVLLSCTQAPVSVENKAINKSSSKAARASSNPFKVKAKTGDTLYTISKEYGVGLRDLIELNKLRPPYVLENDQYVRLPQPTFHVVQPKDTLYAISRSYGLDMGRIVHMNNLSEPYVIKSGMKLLLPSSAYPVEIAAKGDTDDVKFGQASVVQESVESHSRDVVSNDLVVLAKPEKIVETAPAEVISEEVVFAEKSPNKSNEAALMNEIKAHDSKAKNETKEVVPAYVDKVKDSAKAVAPVVEESEEVVFTGNMPKAKTADVAANTKIIEPVLSPSKDIAANVSKSPVVPKSNDFTEFLWPTKGKIVSQFGPKQGGLYNDGINIAAKEGASIKAADSGKVVYSGNELRGYGNLVLVKHNNGFVTAYAHAQKVVVKKGDTVERGQTIAYVGNTGHVSKPQLHFSIRKGRKAMDPQKYLPVS